jgi:hypothetical protein
MRLFLLMFGVCFAPALLGADWNAAVLTQLRNMPQGGGYAATREATGRLQSAVGIAPGRIAIAPAGATPSYCSGATYLVFLKAIEPWLRKLPAETATAFAVQGQPDGVGIWGRWNANGPGTARLFFESGLGRNFESWDEARPGDFMKIFWTSEIGRAEHGHSVIYLGRETVNGEEQVRFWSSNIPGGYGEKRVPRGKIRYALFSRLEHPESLAAAAALPAKDGWLAGLTSHRATLGELRQKTGL